MLFTMGIALYSSRIVLKTLGVSDFGIYNVVNGFVAMFSMLSATFTSSTQRFLSFELGQSNGSRARDVFSISMNIHFALSLLTIISIETFGLWFLNHKMSIPSHRLLAANWVLQFSMLAFAINLLSIPYNAAIIANEKMNIFAYLSFLEVLLKLSTLFILVNSNIDKLILYSVLMALVAGILRVGYGVYCKRQFAECTYSKVENRLLYRDVLSISGWNFLGSSASIFTVEGIGLLLNLFGGGVAINAAKGIASQVQNAIQQLIGNFMVSLNPQITKSYATGNQDYMISLIDRGSRFSFYLFAAIALPISLETNKILSIWLSKPPQYSAEFVRASLLCLALHPFSTLLDQALMSTGRIKNSQIGLSILQLLTIPISFFLLKNGFHPYFVYYGFAFINLISLAFRLYYVHNRTTLSYRYYLVRVLLRPFGVICFSLILPILELSFFDPSIFRVIISTITAELSIFLLAYIIGIDSEERAFFKEKISHIRGKIWSEYA
jgi:O-antigen/teichoic acid export membrane protein